MNFIEGNFHPGETAVVIDDILISGQSVMEGAVKLESAGLKVEELVVFIDHEAGVKERLASNGYRAHSVLNILVWVNEKRCGKRELVSVNNTITKL